VSTRLKMKELERRTGIGRETIRFYIRQGLLPEPERPGRNVAWYDESFVERIRLIKTLQEKRYLPLAVIKSVMAGRDRPTPAEVDALLAIDGKLFPGVEGGLTGGPERVATVATRSGIPVAEVHALADVGVLRVETREGDQWLEAVGVRLVELWGRLRAAGFDAELGFGPESTRLYADVIRMLARTELRMFTQGITGRVDADRAAYMAEQGIDLINQMLALLRRDTLLRYVAEGNIPSDEDDVPGGAGLPRAAGDE
jgi:DNA-binding transcriptional MerR regulator